MNSLRLSIFNLKKNKKEAVAVAFLTMITSLMLGIFVANIFGMHKIFENSFERSGSVNTMVIINEQKYRAEYAEVLEDNYNVSDIKVGRIIFSPATDTVSKDGEVLSYNLLFVNEKTERKIESFVKKDSLSEAEISKLEHPIWLPIYYEIGQDYKPGDTFIITNNGRQYPMEIAGFYETGLNSTDGYGYKCVISDEDMDLFSLIFNSGYAEVATGLYFNAESDFNYDEYLTKCEETSFEKIKADSYVFDYSIEKHSEEQFLKIFMYVIAAISVITLLASIFMIRNKIANDIEDQMQSIGVLEALGYRSKEISLSYVYEYVISAGIGSLIGLVLAIASSSFVQSGVRVMMGREVEGEVNFLNMVLSSIVVIAVVVLIALLRARRVKNYPPVMAFRKGIKTHSFRRNPFPLDKTKNINLRLAIKGFIGDIKTNIGMAVCIITAGVLMTFGVLTVDFFKNGTDGLVSLMAYDLHPLYVTLSNGVDPDEFKEELLKQEGVRKCLLTYGLGSVNIEGTDQVGNTVVFDDYADAESIEPSEGRCPEHYNEIMIATARSKAMNLGVGDSIVLEKDGMERSYIITGVISSMMNSYSNVYLTSDGYKWLMGNITPNTLAVYLEDDVDKEAFVENLQCSYGGTDDAGAGVNPEAGQKNDPDDLETRIQMVADEKMDVLLSQYGVTDVDYTIRIGDKVITGNSRKHMIKDVTNWDGMVKVQMASIGESVKLMSIFAVILVTIVVAVILGIITSSNVKRQRQSLGIMKGLGYSSKDLMTQMALKIMPVTIVSVIISGFLGVIVNKIFWMSGFGSIAKTNVPLLIVTGILLVVFCYVVTYISAGKVKKISVTELMTE
ncbi:MAG: ABC transporter permease [Eubacterium sp.]|nr:ABC transporter permease [Eubacterium sp.]